jgi:ribosome modulation factor
MTQNQNLPEHVAAPSPKSIANAELAKGGAIAALVPESLDDAFRLAKALSGAGNMIPAHFQGQPDAVMAAIVRGMEIGLAPMQALSNIAVINGRASLWGDAIPALMQRAGHQIDVKVEGEGEEAKAVSTLIRGDTGQTIIREFSMQDAQQAGLLNKNGPWKQYPKRMLMHRARSWAARDGAADALMGLQIVEEVQDYQPMRDVTPRPATGAFAARAAAARQDAAPTAIENTPEPSAGDVMPDNQADRVKAGTDEAADELPLGEQEQDTPAHWTDQIDLSSAFPGSDDFTDGVKAWQAGASVTDCPHQDDHARASDWLGGWHEAGKAVA